MRILSIVSRSTSAPQYPTQDEMDKMRGLISELAAAGSLVDAGGSWPGLLSTRVTRSGGEYSIVDGPFAEAKEVVGGYFLLEAPDREAAIALSRRFLEISGDGTFHLIEIVEAPPDQS